MTVKSPFYNKPSTLTSVDSCHKCPSIQFNNNNNNDFGDMNKKDQIKSGIEQSSTHLSINQVIEPCNSSVATSDIGNKVLTSCSNCGTTITPLWRRSPIGETICNACGLYYKARNTTRPVWLKKTKRSNHSIAPKINHQITNHTFFPLAPAPILITKKPSIQPLIISKQERPLNSIISKQERPSNSIISKQERPSNSIISNQEQSNSICSNCKTSTTPLWRRDELGQAICNACGLYFKLHSIHRPITMKRSTIKRRKRVTAINMIQKPLMIHSNDFTKKYIKKNELRPLLPLIRPPTPPYPDTIEPDLKRYPDPIKHISHHPISSLLNPEIQIRTLPSPPLLPNDDILLPTNLNLISSIDRNTQDILTAHRNELKREVNNLTTLLTRTTVMLQNIDHVINKY